MYKKNILVILIVLILFALFFIATRDYEKFKLVDRNQTVKLDEQTKAIVSATKFCNQLDEGYRVNCYEGIGLAIGYNGDENLSKCKELDGLVKLRCYYYMGRFLGEEYDDPLLIMQKCSEAELEGEEYKEECEKRAVEELAKKYAKNITQATEFCMGFKKKYRSQCFKGLGRGIAQYYFQKDYKSLELCNKDLWPNSCKRGYFLEAITIQEKTSNDILNIMESSHPGSSLIIGWGYLNAEKNLENPQFAFTLCNQFSNLTYKEACYQGVSSGLGVAKYKKLTD